MLGVRNWVLEPGHGGRFGSVEGCVLQCSTMKPAFLCRFKGDLSREGVVVGPVIVEKCRASGQRSVLMNCRKDYTHYFEPLPSRKALTHSAAGCLEFQLCLRTMALVLGEQECEGSR